VVVAEGREIGEEFESLHRELLPDRTKRPGERGEARFSRLPNSGEECQAQEKGCGFDEETQVVSAQPTTAPRYEFLQQHSCDHRRQGGCDRCDSQMQAHCSHTRFLGRQIQEEIEAPHEKRHRKKSAPEIHRVEEPCRLRSQHHPEELLELPQNRADDDDGYRSHAVRRLSPEDPACDPCERPQRH